MGHNQIKDLFSQYEKLEKAFVQREKKKGQQWHFGFARFASLTWAKMVINFLDEFKVGGDLGLGSCSLEVVPQTRI